MRLHRGFTALEVMVAGAILSGVLLASIEFMDRLASSASVERRQSMLVQSVNRGMSTIVDTLRTAQIDDMAVDNDGNRWNDNVAFQVPVMVDGNLVDASFDPYWGMPNENGTDTLGYKGVFRFVASGNTLNESELGRDLNNDKDQRDVFDIGRIDEVLYDGPDIDSAEELLVQRRTPDIIIQEHGEVAGQLINDNVADPLFSHIAETFDVRVLQVQFVYIEPTAEIPQFYTYTALVEIRSNLIAWTSKDGNE